LEIEKNHVIFIFIQHGLEILGVKALIVIVNAKKNWFREHLNAKIYTL
jgi:hypothetical protein